MFILLLINVRKRLQNYLKGYIMFIVGIIMFLNVCNCVYMKKEEHSMTKEESAMVGFEIVAYAGDARSKLINALKAAEKGEFEEAEMMIKSASECMNHAHKIQTDMLQAEARGEATEIGFIMIHGQDHLMTTMLLKDVVKNFITLYKRTNI